MRRLRSWPRRAASAVLVVVLLLPALGATLTAELDQLATATAARLAASPAKKEAKLLGKAAKKLKRTTGESTDAKALAQILSAVFGSKTVDETVLAEAQDVLDHLRGLAEGAKVDAEAFIGQLDAKFADRLRAMIAGGDKKLNAGIALVASDPKKATKLFLGALSKYVKSAKFAAKALAKQRAAGGGKLSNKTEMTATLTSTGFTRNFKEFAAGFAEFRQIIVQGCDYAGPADVCRTSLSFAIAYDPQSRFTGSLPTTFVRYSESSDFGNGSGPGVQDVQWAGGGLSVVIVSSTGTRIKGRFSGQALAESGQQPGTITIEGSFVIRRPKAN